MYLEFASLSRQHPGNGNNEDPFIKLLDIMLRTVSFTRSYLEIVVIE